MTAYPIDVAAAWAEVQRLRDHADYLEVAAVRSALTAACGSVSVAARSLGTTAARLTALLRSGRRLSALGPLRRGVSGRVPGQVRSTFRATRHE